MLALAVGGALLLGLLGLLHLFANARPAAVKTSLAWGLGTLGVALMAALLLTGRGASAYLALVMFGPAALQAWRSWRTRRSFSRPAGTSDVETATLAMRLDHETGIMSGTVTRGRFAGRELATLHLPELLELLEDCRQADPDSVPLLEAWLDRAQPEWREEAPPPPASPGGPMTRAEALEVLGLHEGATEADIRAAHRRLMQAAHPDRGGSEWLAARINAARDVLTG
ncbi:hypothetical protein [Roseococcus sp. YIM B11640]|uniref:hypothetical protein n=1 Tax=Roseococcus sp. YIM B11640 TaxID=3133973 RepID=UPI003C7DFD2B